MLFRRLAMSGGVLIALMEMGQFAGPRTVNKPLMPWDFDRTGRPIVCNADGVSVVTYFTPSGVSSYAPEPAILDQLKHAGKTVLVQAYGFTRAEISAELIAAKKRGVDVRIILDRSEETDRHTRAWECRAAGIDVRFDEAHAIAHNKVIVIDGRMVFTGSYNFTDSAAKHNAENCVLIVSEKIAAQFAENWEDHSKHAKEWMPKPP